MRNLRQITRPKVFRWEALAVGTWLVLVGFSLKQDDNAHLLPVLDAAALSSAPGEERWTGIYFQGEPVGYAMTRESASKDGGLFIEQQSRFRLATMGQLQDVVTAGAALLTKDHALARFDFVLSADPVHLVARGEVRPQGLVIEVLQGEQSHTLELPLSERPHIALSLGPSLAGREYTVGESFSVPYFDPVTLAQAEMTLRVVDVELLVNAEEAYWLERTFQGMTSRMLITPAGEVIREESAMGLSLQRMGREEALALVEAAKPVDMVRMTAIKLKKPLPKARRLAVTQLKVSGVPIERLRAYPPIQHVEGDVVTIRMPLMAEIPREPLNIPLPEQAAFLEHTIFLPTEHPEIQAKAAELVEGASDRRDAAKRIHDWVYKSVEKRPVIGVPNGLEVLRSLQGDCNEHTSLYVSLARAAGIPARIAAGVVYAEPGDGTGAFFYHAWPEVYLGGQTPWVPIDPTLNTFPADATHFKLVEGDLDRQIEIISMIGQLQIEVLDAR